MRDHRRTLGLITARGGSKGVPKKNIRMLGGHPLISWTIKAAQQSKVIDTLFVSTDSEEIARVCGEYGVPVPFLRPPELATDNATSVDVVKHVLSALRRRGESYDEVVLLQPTSPFRTGEHIDHAWHIYATDIEASSLVSVGLVEKSPYWMMTVNDQHHLERFLSADVAVSRRQDSPSLYYINGAIYICDTAVFTQVESFVTPTTAFYLMDAIHSVDIDTELDFAFAEFVVNTGYI